MSLSNQRKNQHLMWRAGFGPSAAQLAELSAITPQQLYAALARASQKMPRRIHVVDDYLQGLLVGLGEAGREQRQIRELSGDDRKKIQKHNRQGIRNLNLLWMREMVSSQAQLREKMALFWHGHFACRNLNLFYQQGLLDIIRRHALGNFGTLLKEVSRSAAMLNFLNNQQNRKNHPNENFAREVMELFTLGRGHYTEQDVKEAARAFTGWAANPDGSFSFRWHQHDFGSKTVLGRTGNFDGGEVLDILLEQKQTARFIARKLWHFFVSETIDAERLEWLSDRFYQSGYDLSSFLSDLFTSDWFYATDHMGVQIKSPMELLVGIQRILPMKLRNQDMLLLLQRLLGQVLFSPPNVAGWPGGRNWIDSSTLLMRMRIPRLIDQSDELDVRPKDDDDQMMGRGQESEEPPEENRRVNGRAAGALIAEIDWSLLLKLLEAIPREQLLERLAGILLQTRLKIKPEVVYTFSDPSSRESFIRTAVIQLMSSPEYQLC